MILSNPKLIDARNLAADGTAALRRRADRRPTGRCIGSNSGTTNSTGSTQTDGAE
jgi:hypothetical protein